MSIYVIVNNYPDGSEFGRKRITINGDHITYEDLEKAEIARAYCEQRSKDWGHDETKYSVEIWELIPKRTN